MSLSVINDSILTFEDSSMTIPDTLTEFCNLLDNSDYDLKFDEFDYTGFNPEIFYQELKKKANKKNISNKQFNKDIISVCALVLIRGTNITKIKSKISAEGNDTVSQLESRYDIKKVSSNKLTNKSIILSRFPATFPTICKDLITKGKAIPRILIDGLPKEISFNGGCSFINPENDELKEKYNKWAIEFDKLINGVKADENKVRMYTDIIMRSSILPVEMRNY